MNRTGAKRPWKFGSEGPCLSEGKTELQMSLALAFLGALFFTALLYFIGNPLFGLRPNVNDLASNISTGYLFHKHGLAVYERPTANLLESEGGEALEIFEQRYKLPPSENFSSHEVDRPIVAAWPHVPRPYPPGAYAFFTPLSYLYHSTSIGLEWICLFAIFIFLFLGHLAFFELLQVGRTLISKPLTSRVTKVLAAVFLLFCYLEILRVCMLGAYDILSLTLVVYALVSLLRGMNSRAILLLSAALLFHLRALYYVPIFFWAAWCMLNEEGQPQRMLKDWRNWLSLALLGIFALFFRILSDSLTQDYPVTNKLHAFFLQGSHLPEFATWTLLSTALVAALIRLKNYLLLSVAVWMSFMLLMSPHLKSWYGLFLVPIFLLGVKSENRSANLFAAFFFLVLINGSFFTNSPFDFQLLRDIYRGFQQ